MNGQFAYNLHSKEITACTGSPKLTATASDALTRIHFMLTS